MNKLLAILLSIALYAPCITNIVLYIDCIVTAKNYADKEACSCSITTTVNTKEAQATAPNKLKASSFKADWQIVAGSLFYFNNFGFALQLNWPLSYSAKYLKGFNSSVFRPPSC